jgi:hypothetical protein
VLPDRRLVEFGGRPLAGVKPSKENDRRLLLWWAEDCLKKRRALSADVSMNSCCCWCAHCITQLLQFVHACLEHTQHVDAPR